MPMFRLFLNAVPDNQSPSTRSKLRLGQELSSKLPGLMAHAMNLVAKGHRVELNAAGEGWQVYSQTLDARLSLNVPPLTVIVTMNPVYNGFDFTLRRDFLYRAFLGNVWNTILEIGDGEATACDVRLEWGDAMGGGFDATGHIRGEYGGSTGISQLKV